MKKHLAVLTTILFFLSSCNSNKTEKKNSINISIDSIFITEMNTNGLEENTLINDFNINDMGDNIFSVIKPKMKFWTYKEKDFNEKVKLRFLLTTEPKDMDLDGSLNLVYLGTFNAKNQLIDLLRIGKYAVFSDTDDLETCIINENTIQKHISSFEPSDSGFQRVEKEEKYQILETGKFKKL